MFVREHTGGAALRASSLSLSLPTPHAKFRALGKLRAPGFLHAPSRRHLLASRGERGVAKQSRGRELRVRMLLPAGNKCCLQATIRRRPPVTFDL